MTLSGLFNIVCRVFNKWPIEYHDPIMIVKTLTNMNDDDFNYIITDYRDTNFYINRSNNFRCIYIPFNIKGKECIFINIPKYNVTDAIDIVYSNIYKDAEVMFHKLISRFFPNETELVKRLYSWMAAFKLSEKMTMNISRYDTIIQNHLFDKMRIRLNDLGIYNISTTIFGNEENALYDDALDKWLSFDYYDEDDLFNLYKFLDVLKPEYKMLFLTSICDRTGK